MTAVRARFESAFEARHVDEFRSPHLAEPVPRFTPPSVEALCEALRLCSRENWSVVPIGLGTKLGLSPPRGRVDLVLSTAALAGIVEYETDEGVITARAGTRIADLHDALRPHGHWLSPDVPKPRESTIGGAIGAGISGHDRLRFGPIRRQVLGLSVALADGTLAKSGGRLVKNVTGYDLHRLYTGSHGTLCVILEASLRLHARPEEERWIEIEAHDARELARRARELPIRIVSLIEWSERAPTIAARLFERPDVIAEHERMLLAVWPGARVLAGDQARARADEVRELTAAQVAPPLEAFEPSVQEQFISTRLKQALDPRGVFVDRHFPSGR